MNNKIKPPEIKQIHTGDNLKVLQVTGEFNTIMQQHFSTKEASVTIIEGSAILGIGETEQLLKF